MAFDSNAMLELRHVAADRYQRAGGGGGGKVYKTAQAYYTANGFNDLSPFAKACIIALQQFRQRCEIERAHYAFDMLTAKGGFWDGDEIPF